MSRTLIKLTAVAFAGALALTACGGKKENTPSTDASGKSDACAGGKTDPGKKLGVTTGSPASSFFQLSSALAKEIPNKMPGYSLNVAESGGGVKNIAEIDEGNSHFGWAYFDVLTDAVNGKDTFPTPVNLCAVANWFTSYTYVLIKSDSGIAKIEDLKGKRVSTGAQGSAGEILATRMFKVYDIDVKAGGIHQFRYTIAEGVAAMKKGDLDAMIVVTGQSQGDFKNLFAESGDKFKFLAVDAAVAKLQTAHGKFYEKGTIKGSSFGIKYDTETITVGAQLFAAASLPADLVYNFTKAIFDSKDALGAAHPDGKLLDKAKAPQTAPVPLHAGAKRYYDGK